MDKKIVFFAKSVRKKFPPKKNASKTRVKPKLNRLGEVKLLLTDLYGTIFVANQRTKTRQHRRMRMQGMREAVKFLGLQNCFREISSQKPAEELNRWVREEIAHQHARKRRNGAKSPEVRIERVWKRALGRIYRECGKSKPKGFALEAKKACYLAEWLHEPTGLYAGFFEAAETLREKGVELGIASNSQFNTKINLNLALQEQSKGRIKKWRQLFAPQFSSFSFEAGESKPSPRLFERILENAEKNGIKRKEIAIVGNDMLKDVAAGKRLGFKGILFAGDKKSLRMRRGEARIRKVKADAIVTEWKQVVKVVG